MIIRSLMPKPLIFCLLLVSLIMAKVSAQQTVPVYEIKADTASSAVIPNEYLQRLDDTSGRLTINDVNTTSIDSRFFQVTGKEAITKAVNSYWLRFNIKNTLARPVKMMMYSNSGMVEYYMQQPDGKWQKQTNGRDLAYNKTDGFKRYQAVYFEIQPGQEALFYKHYLFDDFILSRLAGKSHFAVAIGYYEPFVKRHFIDKDEMLENEGDVLLFGFMALAGIMTLIFYILIKDKLYLYFSVAAFMFGFISQNVANDLFFHNHPVLSRYLGASLFQAVFIFCVWRFFDLFFEFGKTFPRIAKFMLWLTVLLTVVSYITSVVPGWQNDVYSTLGLSYLLLIVAIVILALLNRKTRSFKKLLTVLPFVLACFFAFLNGISGAAFGISLNGNLVGQIVLACICWLVIAFMWTFLDRLLTTIKQNEAERTKLVQEQNVRLELKVKERTAELQTSLENLKTTQRQLIQSEKMASLGELTAGIAHEIQNPLNFINNFSEVSAELIAEMNEELKTGNIEEGMEIAADIETNLQKINTHGKRADAIVKGMLQHSRTSSDKKEPTDINALCDEYLRLCYHGLRAKDKSFNAALETHFAEGLPNPEVIPQDIGRVLLNIFNNAFYSVTEKKKINPDFEPKITVRTEQQDNYLVITIKDNGTGIPQNVVDKIYQPFFTTKPTGQGTGLGLSLSYDIVTKMHGGELIVNTKDGEFAEFVIKLPVN